MVYINAPAAGQLVLGNDIIEVIESYSYQGRGEQSGQRRIYAKTNEAKARKMMGMVINGKSREINKYEYGRCLWKGMAVPHCFYRSEITHYRAEDLRKLEAIQNQMGKWCIGAPRETAIEALRREMGWISFRE